MKKLKISLGTTTVSEKSKTTKNGKPGLKILPPLYVHNEDGSYTVEVFKMFS